jgi:O-acetyl-ADP-ribose deacetylase (regulator of RNase III)
VIEVRVADVAAVESSAVLRPVSADWAPVTPAMRRLEAAAGEQLAEQCARLGELPVGSAAITGGGALSVDFIVHVVVRSRDEGVTLAGVGRGLRNGLRRINEWALERVVMPPLGTGAGNLDAEESAGVMVPLLLEHMRAAQYPRSVVVAVESDYEREVFENELNRQK